MNNSILPNLTDEELDSINFALMSRYGLDFTGYEIQSYKRRISRIMHKYELNNVVELWQKLLYDKEFVSKFSDEISVGMTEMFRNPEVWTFLKKFAKSNWQKKSNIHCWHAGCSTGEEFYSMAIVMQEAGMFDKTKFFCSDLSDKSVLFAQKGIYEADLIHKYETLYQAYNPDGNFKYFYRISDNVGIMNPLLKANATFVQHNLVKDRVEQSFDIIFCRNVMIYFNDALKLKVLQLFHQSLLPGGLFILGHFDAMPQSFGDYFEYYDPSLKIFIKK